MLVDAARCCLHSHITGATGRGTPELTGVGDRVHIINSTLGKALGGACGGYTTGPKQVQNTLCNTITTLAIQ